MKKQNGPHQGPRGFPSLPLACAPQPPSTLPRWDIPAVFFPGSIFLCSHWFLLILLPTPHSLEILAGQPGSSAGIPSTTVLLCRSSKQMLPPTCASLCCFTVHMSSAGPGWGDESGT